MRIMKVKAVGLKSRDIDMELPEVGVIVGPNGSGKSTVIDAVLLAVLGWRPGWGGRTVDDTLMAARQDRIEVEIEVDCLTDGIHVINRAWERTYYSKGAKKGEFKEVVKSVSCSTVAAGSHQKTQEAAIRDLFGLSADKQRRDMEERCLDPDSFLDMSSDKRRGALFRMAAKMLAGHWSAGAVTAELSKTDLFDEAGLGISEADPVGDLETHYDEAVERLSEVRASRREAEAAVDGIEEDLDQQAPSPEAVAELEAAAAKAAAEVVAHGETLGCEVEAARAKLRAARNANAEIEGDRKTAEELRSQLAALRRDDGGTEGRGEVVEAIADIEAPFGVRSLESLRATAESAKQEAERPTDLSPTEPTKEAIARTESIIGDLRNDLGAAQAEVDKGKALGRVLAAIHGGAECPTCLQAVDPEHVERLTSVMAKHNAFGDQVLEIEGRIKTEGDNLSVARNLLERQTREINSAAAERTGRWRKAEQAVRDCENELAGFKRRLAVFDAGTDRGEEIAGLEARLAEVDKRAERQLSDISSLEAEVFRIETEGSSRRAELDEAAKTAKDAHVEAKQSSFLRSTALDLRAKAAERKDEEERAAAVVAFLGPRGLLGKVATTVIEPYNDTVNRLLSGLRMGEFVVRVWDERGRPTLQMGLLRDGGFSPVETLSGGEKTTVRAGMALAMARVSELPWRPLLVDEVEGVDADRQGELLAQVRTAVGVGRASQALLVGCWWAGGGETTEMG